MMILSQAEQWPHRVAVAQGLSTRLPTDEVMKYFHSIIGPNDLDPDFDRDIRANGVREPIEISTDGQRAAITEGHHRTLSAYGAGHPDVPVRLFRVRSLENNRGGPLGEHLKGFLGHNPLEYGT